VGKVWTSTRSTASREVFVRHEGWKEDTGRLPAYLQVLRLAQGTKTETVCAGKSPGRASVVLGVGSLGENLRRSATSWGLHFLAHSHHFLDLRGKTFPRRAASQYSEKREQVCCPVEGLLANHPSARNDVKILDGQGRMRRPVQVRDG
jgi:hypothetical protein